MMTNRLKESGGIDVLSEEENMSLLPLLSPSEIRHRVDSIEGRPLLEEAMAFDGVIGSIEEMLELVLTQRVLGWTSKSNEENPILLEVQRFLSKLPKRGFDGRSGHCLPIEKDL